MPFLLHSTAKTLRIVPLACYKDYDGMSTVVMVVRETGRKIQRVAALDRPASAFGGEEKAPMMSDEHDGLDEGWQRVKARRRRWATRPSPRLMVWKKMVVKLMVLVPKAMELMLKLAKMILLPLKLVQEEQMNQIQRKRRSLKHLSTQRRARKLRQSHDPFVAYTSGMYCIILPYQRLLFPQRFSLFTLYLIFSFSIPSLFPFPRSLSSMKIFSNYMSSSSL